MGGWHASHHKAGVVALLTLPIRHYTSGTVCLLLWLSMTILFNAVLASHCLSLCCACISILWLVAVETFGELHTHTTTHTTPPHALPCRRRSPYICLAWARTPPPTSTCYKQLHLRVRACHQRFATVRREGCTPAPADSGWWTWLPPAARPPNSGVVKRQTDMNLLYLIQAGRSDHLATERQGGRQPRVGIYLLPWTDDTG